VTFGDPLWDSYPVAGDWDGDGQDTVGLYHRGEGKFYLRNSNTTGIADAIALYGNAGDIPVVGRWSSAMNYDGIGVFRPGIGLGFYTYQKVNGDLSGTPIYDNFYVVFGNPGDIPVAGDWDGDGYDSIGVYTPSNGVFSLSNSLVGSASYDYEILFGDLEVWPFTGGWICIGNPCNIKLSGLGFYRNSQFDLRDNLSPVANSYQISYGNNNLSAGTQVVPVAGYWSTTYLNEYKTPTVTPTSTLYICQPSVQEVVVPALSSEGGGQVEGADGGGGVPRGYYPTPVRRQDVCIVPTIPPLPTYTPTPIPACQARLTQSRYAFENLFDAISYSPLKVTPTPPHLPPVKTILLNANTVYTVISRYHHSTNKYVEILDNGKSYWFDSSYAIEGVQGSGDCNSIKIVVPTATVTSTLTPTGTITATLPPTSTNPPTPWGDSTGYVHPGDAYTKRAFLEQFYGVYLTDATVNAVSNGLTVTPSPLSYWLSTNYNNRNNNLTRVDSVYDSVSYIDAMVLPNLLAVSPQPIGVLFKQVFGIRTEFRYTGETQNYAAFVARTEKRENIVLMYTVNTSLNDAVYPSCGSKQTIGYNPQFGVGKLDMTKCTITHELGHVIAARSAKIAPRPIDLIYESEPLNGFYIFGRTDPACPPGGSNFDPGTNGYVTHDQSTLSGNSWPWRENRISPYIGATGSYRVYLCDSVRNPPLTVIFEFEADMFMNYVQGFFSQAPNTAQSVRFDWIANQAQIWSQNAREWTTRP
jgi:hypothetical protein